MPSLLDLILEFVQQNVPGQSLLRWELVTTTNAVTLRGSYLPIPPGNLDLLQLPEAQDGPIDNETAQAAMFAVGENTQTIRDAQGDGAADAYATDATTYVQVLERTKPDLLTFTVANPNTANTGICGETANKLAQIMAGAHLESTDFDGLVGALTMEELPTIYAVVTIGGSHRFLVQKINDQVVLLQSWVGRFSLARWVQNGAPNWADKNQFVQTLQAAIPAEVNPEVNPAYNQLFNVPGNVPTPSPHIRSEVTADIFMSDTDDIIQQNIVTAYGVDSANWT